MLGRKILSADGAPEIVFDPVGIIIIRGRLINGNIRELSDDVEQWLDKYLTNPADVTYITLYLEYINKASSGIIYNWLKKIITLLPVSKKCIVNWYYEEGDEDILENGEYLSSELKIPFNFIEIYEALLPDYFSREREMSLNNLIKPN
jgi:hypothetical protein